MSMTSSCIAVCAPLTTVASVLLFMMAHMLRHGNWTFVVLAAENHWDTAQKADVCRRGAVLYLLTAVALWMAVFLQAPVYRLWMMMPWNRSRRDAEERRAREALLDPTLDGGPARGGRGGRAARRSLSRFGQQQEQLGEEATEMSALDWGAEGMGLSSHLTTHLAAAAGVGGAGGNNTSSPLGGTRQDALRGINAAVSGGSSAPAATASPGGRRFPNFLRSLADAASLSPSNASARAGNNNNSNNDGSDGPEGGSGALGSSASGSGGGAWGRARGLRSRAAAVDTPAAVTIRPDYDMREATTPPGFGGPTVLSVPALLPSQHRSGPYNDASLSSNGGQHANLWGDGNDLDGVDDSDFLSDVELDTQRHNGLRQLRASGWGMQQQQQPLAPTRRHRRGNTSGGVASPAGVAQTPSMITTLWPRAGDAVSRSSSPASSAPGGRQRPDMPSAGPTFAIRRQNNKNA